MLVFLFLNEAHRNIHIKSWRNFPQCQNLTRVNLRWSYLHDSPLYSLITNRRLSALAPTPLAACRKHHTWDIQTTQKQVKYFPPLGPCLCLLSVHQCVIPWLVCLHVNAHMCSHEAQQVNVLKPMSCSYTVYECLYLYLYWDNDCKCCAEQRTEILTVKESPTAATTLISPGLSSWTAQEVEYWRLRCFSNKKYIHRTQNKSWTIFFYLNLEWWEMDCGLCKAPQYPWPRSSIVIFYEFHCTCSHATVALEWSWKTYKICYCGGFIVNCLFSVEGGICLCPQERLFLRREGKRSESQQCRWELNIILNVCFVI